MSHSFALARSHQSQSAAVVATGLSWFERGVLAVGIFEIPLQLDKYYFYRESDAEFGSVGGLNVSLTTLALVILYGHWLMTAAVRRSPRIDPILFGIPMLAYLVFNAFSLLVASAPSLVVFDLAILLQAYLLFFYIANRVLCRSDLLFLLWVLTAIVAFQALAILGLSMLGPSAHGIEYHLGPVDFSVREDGRPEGTMRSPNGASSVLFLFTMAIVPLCFGTRLSPRGSRVRGQLAFAIVAFGLLAILLTQTRGAMLSVVVGLGIFGTGAILRGWLPAYVIVGGAITACFAMAILGHFLTRRFVEDDGDSASSRVHLSAIAAQTIQDHMFLGVGAGNCHLGTAVYANQSDYRSEWFFITHCKYLLVWVETGLFGLLAFLAILGSGLANSWRAWRSPDRVIAAVGLALMACIAGHMLHLFVDIFNSRVQIQSLWLVLAMAAVAGRLAVQIRDGQGTHDAFPAVVR